MAKKIECSAEGTAAHQAKPRERHHLLASAGDRLSWEQTENGY
jgi:hypothetical protein